MTNILICNKPECTLSQTGKCVLDNDPAICTDRLNSLETSTISDTNVTGEPILDAPKVSQVLAASYTLTRSQVDSLMQERYCKIIGILGTPGSGKTACLVSLYLLLAHNRLNKFEFRDSKTIRAFEEISMGARRWNNTNYPDQLTLHTDIADERQAGFLHLRINSDEGRILDLLLPDLPGEWSNSLVETNRAERLNFLKSADTFWLMVNGQEIENIQTRFHTEHRVILLMERIATLLDTYRPPITLVVTHKDRVQLKEVLYTKLIEKSKSLGFNLRVIEIASFSNQKDVIAGDGISNLIADLLSDRSPKYINFWDHDSMNLNDRQMMFIRKNSE